MNIGKLYQFKQYFWYLYPSKDKAALAALAAEDAADAAAITAAYWSKQFKCNVSYISPYSIFCLLEKDERFCKILTTNGELGWILYSENEGWIKGWIEEVNQ